MQQVFKRLFDIGLAASALVALIPALLLIALLIRLDSHGPVLFRQRRLGRHGVPFPICKFRTMHVNAPDLRNPDGSTVSANDDPRLTRIGRLLRDTSLDELPQFWNVLVGDMSLVGPRPDQVDQLRFYGEGEQEKLAVRPGITGLAQISGRNRISWEQRKLLDRSYVRNWSLTLDLKILLDTIPYVLLRRDINQTGDITEGRTL